MYSAAVKRRSVEKLRKTASLQKLRNVESVSSEKSANVSSRVYGMPKHVKYNTLIHVADQCALVSPPLNH